MTPSDPAPNSDRGPDRSTDAHDPTSRGTRAIVTALLANLGIAVAKFIGFLATRSGSMLAEAVHSVVDTGDQILLLVGGRRARRRADAEHPFGYGRERFFWAFVVAVVLFTLGGAFAIADGVDKILHPHELERIWWAVGILGVAALLEGLSFRTAVRESRRQRAAGVSLWRYIRNAKAPEVPVVLLEDAAALVGLFLALAALLAAHVTGDARWDGYGTVAIGGLLATVASVLAVEMKSLLIGESASPRQRETIAAALEIEPAVVRVIHVRTEHLGPDELLVAAKVEFLHGLTLPEVADAVNRVESNVRANVPQARVMYIEPDVSRDLLPAPMVAEHGGTPVTEPAGRGPSPRPLPEHAPPAVEPARRGAADVDGAEDSAGTTGTGTTEKGEGTATGDTEDGEDAGDSEDSEDTAGAGNDEDAEDTATAEGGDGEGEKDDGERDDGEPRASTEPERPAEAAHEQGPGRDDEAGAARTPWPAPAQDAGHAGGVTVDLEGLLRPQEVPERGSGARRKRRQADEPTRSLPSLEPPEVPGAPGSTDPGA